MGKVVAFLGWFLIVGGVVGEWFTEGKVNTADSIQEGLNLPAETTRGWRCENLLPKAQPPRHLCQRFSEKANDDAGRAKDKADAAASRGRFVHQEVLRATGQLAQLEAEAQKTNLI